MSTLDRVMNRELKKTSADTLVVQAAERMRNERVGSLMVEKNGEVVGIITETDVVRKGVATGTEIAHLAVEKIMAAPIVTIEVTRTVQDAHDMMADHGLRHLGVTEGGKLIGLVTVRDLLVYFKRMSEPKITQD